MSNMTRRGGVPGNARPSLQQRRRRRGVAVFGAATLVGAVLSMPSPAQALPGEVVRVSHDSASDSLPTKTSTATCPVGKQLVGAGANINNGGARVIIDEIRPNGSPYTAPTAVTVKAFEDETGTAANWSITAYGICTSLPITDLVRVSATSAVSSNNARAAVASCPPGNRTLLGSGFDIGAGNGEVNVSDLIPDLTGLSGEPEVVVRAHEDSNGLDSNWSVTAFAICGVVNGDLDIHESPHGPVSANQSYTVSCPEGDRLLSGGVDIRSTEDGAGAVFDQPNERLVIDEIHPNGSLFSTPDELTVTVLEASPSNEFWHQYIYVVCYDPA